MAGQLPFHPRKRLKMTTVHRLEDPNSSDVVDGARLIANAFMGDVWPNGLTPAVLQWRTSVLQRGIVLGTQENKPARVYVAKNSDGKVIGVTYWAVTTADDPSGEWTSLVPAPAMPFANGDMIEEKWKHYQGRFRDTVDKVIQAENRADLNFLVVDPAAQRSGAGTLLLKKCIEEVGPNYPTVLISAATPSAGPFYAKHGLREFPSPYLQDLQGFPDTNLKFRAWMYEPGSIANDQA